MNAIDHKVFDRHRDDEDLGHDELASKVRYERTTGDLILENGRSRLVLRRDGTIRLEGIRIIGVAEDDVVFEAATINLN